MFFTEKKLRQRIDELSQHRVRDWQSPAALSLCYDREGVNGALPPGDNADWLACGPETQWREKDIYVWLRIDWHMPDIWQHRQVIGHFDFSLGRDRREFEALLFIDELPWSGVDQNHPWVVLPKERAGSTVRMYCRIWSGILEGKIRQHFEAFHVGNAIQTVRFGWRDEACDDLYYTALSAWQSVMALDENSADRARLLHQTDLAFNVIDWRKPGDEAFYKSVHQAAEQLRAAILSSEKHHPVTVHAVGHTHIDVAFLWQLKHTREKCARSFSTVLRLMERYPQYCFFQSQPQLYAWLKSDYPVLYNQIRERIVEGRWEIDGAMWLEADCNIPSGESLVRQVLYGRRFMQQEFGVTPRCLWLPDVFGYSWALPQILKKSGISYFMTTKISWNEFNQLPHDTFTWRGIDGSEVLAHFVTTPEEGFPRYTYNGIVNAESVQGLWNNYRDKTLNQTLMLPYGYGDGGGGPNEEMLELLERFSSLPGLPEVEHGGALSFFDGLAQRQKESGAWQHVWDGELYFESHRGTYTSQAQVKRANRRGELSLRHLEWLSVVSALHQKGWQDYPEQPLRDAWTLLLRNQFHDIIPGSSIAEVYQDAAEEYQQLNDSITQLTARAAAPLLTNTAAAGVTLFNSCAWPRYAEPVFLAGRTVSGWVDTEGQPVPSQLTEGGCWLAPSVLNPLEAVSFHAAATAAVECDNPFHYQEGQLDTPLYRISWNKSGQLIRIWDRQQQRDVLAEPGNIFTVYEDKPLKYDAWDIEIFHVQKSRTITGLTAVSLTASGPLLAEVSFQWQDGESQIRQRMRVYRHSPRIDFVTDVDWFATNQLLKVRFPVAIRATEATYDIQFGNVRRSTTWNTSWDYARFESVVHQWADLSESNYGVSLLNDSKYGQAIKDNVMQLTLIKSAISPDPHADQGKHHFTYALLPHAGDWRQACVAHQAWFLNETPSAMPGILTKPLVYPVRFSHPCIQLDAIKQAEDEPALLVRMHEFTGGRQQVTLHSDYPLSRWVECDLMEQPEHVHAGSEPVSLSFLPYEIKTLKLYFS